MTYQGRLVLDHVHASSLGHLGVLAYGKTRDEALQNVEVLALRVLADRVEHGEPIPEVARLFVTA